MLSTMKFEQGCCKKSIRERNVQIALHAKIGGLREVQCKHGFIDILTNDVVIEVKTARDWKHAVGQVTIYGQFFTTHSKAIALYDSEGINREEVELSCQQENISVMWLNVSKIYTGR